MKKGEEFMPFFNFKDRYYSSALFSHLQHHLRSRAKADRKRYEEQMAKYQPPDRQSNRKRNKTGYNMFFSWHVNKLKDENTGVPSERGSVARIVGNVSLSLSSVLTIKFMF